MNELAVCDNKQGVTAYRMSSDAADLCKGIVLASAQDIQGKKYVRVEGWQAIAIAHGCVASSGDVERTDTGFRAIGRVMRMSDGMLISQAEGFVGDDEATWGKRAEYARRAMAQTRAISRACRSAFAHVVVMMNAGLSTTPAEEVPTDGFEEHRKAPETKAEPITEDAQTLVASIDEIESKSGTNKNNKPYTKFGVHVGGKIYGTFDKKIADQAEFWKGQKAKITYMQEGKFLTLLSVTDPESEA